MHLPGPVRQIVSLVHQEQIVAAAFKKALQADHRVEQVVVISHDHIAPEREVQPQFEGADGEPPGQVLQRGAGELVFVQRLPQGIPDAVVVAVGVGAGLGSAFPLLQQADGVLGGESNAFQRKAGLAFAQQGQRILRRLPGGGAGGEIKYPLAAALAHGLESGKQGAHGFADAGGRLAEQAAFVPQGPVHRPCQSVLACPVFLKGEPQLLQRLASGHLPGGGTLGPGGIPGQQIQHKVLQLTGGEFPAEIHHHLVVYLEIGQPHRDGIQPVLPGVDGRVHLSLGPVHRVHVLVDLFGGSGHSLDLIHHGQAVLIGEDAIRPAIHQIVHLFHSVFLLQVDLGLVAGPGLLLQPPVDARALIGTVKAGEPAVDAAGLQ